MTLHTRPSAPSPPDMSSLPPWPARKVKSFSSPPRLPTHDAPGPLPLPPIPQPSVPSSTNSEPRTRQDSVATSMTDDHSAGSLSTAGSSSTGSTVRGLPMTPLARTLSSSSSSSSVISDWIEDDDNDMPFTFYGREGGGSQPVLCPATNSSTTLPLGELPIPSFISSPRSERRRSMSSLGSRLSRGSRATRGTRRSKESRRSRDTDVSVLPSAEDMLEAQEYEVFGEDGKAIAFGDLYPKTKSNPDGPPPRLVVFFLRIFFCGPCQDYVKASVNKLDIEALEAANISVAIIVNGSKDGIKGYRKTLKCPFPIYADLACGLYEIFRFRAGLDIAKIVHPDHKPKYNQAKLPVQMATGFVRAMVHFPRGYQGFGTDNLTQMGGEVVIGPDNRCEFIHRMTHPRDHMEAVDVVRMTGINIPLKGEHAPFLPLHPVNSETEKQLRALQLQLMRRDSLASSVAQTIDEHAPVLLTSDSHLGAVQQYNYNSFHVPTPSAKSKKARGRTSESSTKTNKSAFFNRRRSEQIDQANTGRLLANYLDGSDNIGLSVYPEESSATSPTLVTSASPAFMHSIVPHDYKTASDYKAAVVQGRFGGALPAIDTAPLHVLSPLRSCPRNTA